MSWTSWSKKAGVGQTLLALGASVLMVVVVFINLALTREVRQLRARSTGSNLDSVAERMSAIVGADLEGKRREIRFEPQRRYLVITFAPGCPYCKKSLPNWKRIVSALDRRLWDVIWVSRDSVDTAATFVQAEGIRDLVIADVSYRAYAQLGLVVVPRTIVLSGGGTVIRSLKGELSDARMNEMTNLLIAPTDR